MPLIEVNIAGDGISEADETRARLAGHLSGLAPSAPVIVLIHGYKHSPDVAAHNPHTHILSLTPRDCWKAVSWPARLGLTHAAARAPLKQASADEPLCIALGWHARGTLWQAYGAAAEAGRGLARLVTWLRDLGVGVPVQVLAHSLGARVALGALPHLEPGAMGRAVLLAAAEMQSRARTWLDCPAGRTLEVLNVTSRENDLFDCALEWLVAPHRWSDRALGQGLGQARPGWLDLRIDDAQTRAALARLDLAIAAPDRRICHWSVYLRPGVFDIYRAILAEDLSLDRLRAVLPRETAPRWSRLVQPPSLDLPFPRREAS